MFPSQLLISTKHHKEQLLRPYFEPLGVELLIHPDFDTDQFGTFCGQIPRAEGPQLTVKEKCLAGMSLSGYRQGLASEGSFGPHPTVPFIQINEEWLVYIDLDNQLELFGHSTSLEVCHDQLHYSDAERLLDFLQQIDFGAQGLVLKNAVSGQALQKGITNKTVLFELLERHPSWLLETDLRAHMNPKRQANIIAAAQNLLARSRSLCPQCAAPNFWITERLGQLPCCQCGQATQTYQSLKYACWSCAHEHTVQRQDLICQDPAFCSHCNP